MVSERVRRVIWRLRKRTRQALLPRVAQRKSIVFILGCQRSGTTLLSEIFDKDLNCRSYGEFSELTSDDTKHGIRLNDLESVRQIVQQSKTPLVVVKPLVESQRAAELLSAFDNCYVIWVYRQFKDVALSNAKKFSERNAIDFLEALWTQESGNWRSEKVSEQTRQIVGTYLSSDMNPMDAQVLVWYSRNVLFFEQGLEQFDNVLLSRYEDLVTEPAVQMRRIYDFIGQRYPGDQIAADANASSIGRGAGLSLSPEIEALGSELLKRLDAVLAERA